MRCTSAGRGDLSPEQGRRLIEAMERLPADIETALAAESTWRRSRARYADSRSAFYIGRGPGFPIALEGAQKLKEISYIHAEAYPASELKHGPLALVCPNIPTVIALPHDALLDKSIASLEEVRARSGPVIALTHPGDDRIAERADAVIEVPALGGRAQPGGDGGFRSSSSPTTAHSPSDATSISRATSPRA